jgi:hypothetical protein
MNTYTYYLLLFVGSSLIFLLTLTPWFQMLSQEGFQNTQPAYKSEKAYQDQVKRLTDAYEPYASGKRPVLELVEKEQKVPESERILLNYHALACRYPGFLGPFPAGYMDPDIGVLTAVKAGCRTFVLDIDYIDDCKRSKAGYFPRLIVRDIQGKLMINEQTQGPLCQDTNQFELRTICQKINDYAFSSSAPQATDPIIIVLYFHRRPPGALTSKSVLDYYSAVAKALSPFKNRLLTNELEGGKFYRHQQEGKLLMNPITNYNGRVLIFNNANTSGFAEVKTYRAMDDLDFLTNLRLFSTQTKLGVTEPPTGSSFGILQAVEDYLMVPDDRREQVQGETTQKWSIALPTNPIQMPTKEAYDKLTTSIGIHCVPALIFDPMATPPSSYLFQDTTFKTYGFRYKPDALRYRKPPVVVPGEPNPSMNARQGQLVPPSL